MTKDNLKNCSQPYSFDNEKTKRKPQKRIASKKEKYRKFLER